MHILERSIRNATAAGRTALIPFITAGFPTMPRFWECLADLDASGADIIEIGVPFSDPVADGPVVAEASSRVLENGVTLSWILHALTQKKAQGQAYTTPLVLMSYYNPFMRYGLTALAPALAAAGISGCIVPDLPLDESDDLRQQLAPYDIALIALVASNTSTERMRAYADVSRGYVYVVSVMGTTGARNALPPEVCETLYRARKTFTVPIALGFGLRDPTQLAELPAEARPDAAIFGSALLQHIDSGQNAASFLRVWQ